MSVDCLRRCPCSPCHRQGEREYWVLRLTEPPPGLTPEVHSPGMRKDGGMGSWDGRLTGLAEREGSRDYIPSDGRFLMVYSAGSTRNESGQGCSRREARDISESWEWGQPAKGELAVRTLGDGGLRMQLGDSKQAEVTSRISRRPWTWLGSIRWFRRYRFPFC